MPDSSEIEARPPAFWSLISSELEKFNDGWLITEFACDNDWSRREMHPHEDEFVYLPSGDIEFHLELPSGPRITGRGAVLVPRGAWHTARVLAPSRMSFAARGAGTRHRSASGG